MKVDLRNHQGHVIASDSRGVTIPLAVKMSPPIPADWAVEDGEPHITGDIDLAITDADARRGSLVVRLLDKTGQVRALWIPNGGAFAPTPLPEGHIQYLLNPGPLPVGTYTVALDLGGGKETNLEQTFTVLPRGLASSSINSDGYLVYDGKPIFPLGIFNGDARLKEMSEAGFTINHAYNACDVIEGREPNDSAALDFSRSNRSAPASRPYFFCRAITFFMAIGQRSVAAFVCSRIIPP